MLLKRNVDMLQLTMVEQPLSLLSSSLATVKTADAPACSSDYVGDPRMKRKKRIMSSSTSFCLASTQRRLKREEGLSSRAAIAVFGSLCGLFLFYINSFQSRATSQHPLRAVFLSPERKGELALSVIGPCAINLYGLPRKFKEMVLPGLIENIIKTNARYQCDYFAHYYDRTEESDYRGADQGRGGTIDPEEVKLLSGEVEKAHRLFVRDHPHQGKLPIVEFIRDTEEGFFERYNPLLKAIFSKRGQGGNLVYMPLSEKMPFPNATVLNIIKMWHSQESVWNLMEPSSTGSSSPLPRSQQQHYSRVAMLRSDILYVTPIDIYALPDGSIDHQNQFAVIPNFGNFPISDRMIFGPSDAVRIWAAGRFLRLDEHVNRVAKTGDGIHPERFLFHTIFPAISDAGVPILPGTSDLCFLRVRSDLSVRIGDCGRGCVSDHNRRAVEYILQRSCEVNRANPDVAFLECSDEVRQQFPTQTAFVKTTWEGCPWKV